MAYCTNCGIEIEEGKLLCDKCEKTLSDEAQATAVVIKKEMIPADKKDMTMAGIVMLPCLLFVNCLFRNCSERVINIRCNFMVYKEKTGTF